MTQATRAEICVWACAEAWRGDGEILASPIGTIPALAARLARATFEPDLVMTDGEAHLVARADASAAGGVVEGWLPYRSVFDVVWSGRRHVMMGATQIDRYGNQNISAIGEWQTPKVQLLGSRGAPGNTVNHPTSYWIPNHSPRTFVERVDFVSGVGYDRARRLGRAGRFHEIRLVVSNLGVFDFETPERAMRLRSVHPGVTVDDVRAATAFDLTAAADVPETARPDADALRLLRDVLDPDGLRDREVAPG